MIGFCRTGRLAEMIGFEPTNEGVKVPCLTAWLHLYICFHEFKLIFSRYIVFILETKLRLKQHSPQIRLMAEVAGFEPANKGVKVPCLTAWLYLYISLATKRIPKYENLLRNLFRTYPIQMFSKKTKTATYLNCF